MTETYTVVSVPGYTEGYVKARGYWLFYKSIGQPRKGTILCLHGGPGGSHDSLLPMARFSEEGFRVVFYDQLGCGRSDHPLNPGLYSVEGYVQELEEVRTGLGLGKVHLYGHSWGGFLDTAYATEYSLNLSALMISSGSCSTPLCVSEMRRLRSELPKETLKVLDRYEDDGDFANDEYLRAMEEVYRRHLCRLDPWPPMLRSLVEQKRQGFPGYVYKLMWGENEFLPTGSLRYWDVTPDLARIEVPTLITCGRYDEVTPKNSEALQRGIKGSKMVVFERSSHTSRYEEPERHAEVYGQFLSATS